MALLAPPHNVGKDEYTVDLGSNEKLYWLDTESGLLGAFGFEGACTARDGSCDVPSTSMGACFCNVKAMKWNTAAPLPYDTLKVQRTLESSKVDKGEEGLSSIRPDLVTELLQNAWKHMRTMSTFYISQTARHLFNLSANHPGIGCGAKLNLSKSPDADVLKAIVLKLQKRVESGAVTLLIKDLTEEGQMLLDDPELWMDRLTFLWECHAYRKRQRTTEDGTFLLHNKGVITSTFTGDWLLTEGESRDKLGEWRKKMQVRHQDQRRMLQANMHCQRLPFELLEVKDH